MTGQTDLVPSPIGVAGPLLDAAVANVLSPLTRKMYLRHLGRFVRFLDERGTDPARATGDDVLAWWSHLRGMMKPSSVNAHVAAVRRLYREAERRHLVAENPATVIPTLRVSKQPQGRALDLDEVRRLLAACPADGRLVDLRDRVAIAFLLYTGCRVSELCRVTFEDFATERGHRTVRLFRKRGIEDRQKMTADLCLLVDAWRARAGVETGRLLRGLPRSTAGADAVRTGGLDRTTVYRIVSQRSALAGIGRDISPHDLRRTWITTAAELEPRTMRVAAAAGHTDPATTMRYDHQRGMLADHPSDRVAAWIRGETPAEGA